MNISTVNFTASPSFGPLTGLGVSVYVVNLLFGFPTHSYIIWLIIRNGGISSEFFILNLSVCEISNCVTSLFSILMTWFSSLSTLALVLFGLFFTSRPLFQSLICVERYLAVVHPVTFLKFKPLRYRIICSIAAWSICLISCLCCVLLNTYYREAYTVVFSMMFFIFLAVQLLFFSAVLRALKQSGPGERGREREEENHMKRRAFYLILITIVSLVIAYVPYSLLGFFAFKTTEVIEIFWFIGLICFVLCGFVQPVLYLNRAGKLTCFCSI